ncbi:undecaprenyldiphospho-muramoylpentapeptide beta-N-acetylglucosaminyltransferase [Rheinheimera sp. WS51]|uniref:undecaprenyldiphospho-muramoylpentapeptide beta-N-acetylglucosaminyltransferase n=1 Tax=Rheinheimera sp. WS51 TaxID=3425886 RepID=UPI003D8F0A3F
MTKLNKSPRILIMAGGTGGHIFPAKAVAMALLDQGWQVDWLGSHDRMEAQLVPSFGIPFHSIQISGLRGKTKLSLLKAPWMLIKSVWQSRRIIKQLQPDVVLGFGGYASGPGGLAAWLRGVPLLIHEQNAVAGSTNKLLAKFARQVLVAFPTAFSALTKQRLVGNPVRAELISAGHQPNLDNVSTNEKSTNQENRSLHILVIGGSLGAKALNEQLPAIFSAAAKNGQIKVQHQTGPVLLASTQACYSELAQPGLSVDVAAFIDDMASAYRWADLVICRAGASTVSEVASAGVAAIFVPLPNAIDDHQTANANWLSQQQAALVIKQTDLTAANLLPLLQEWLADKAPLRKLAAAAKSCALDNATEQVVQFCQQVVGQPVTGTKI